MNRRLVIVCNQGLAGQRAEAVQRQTLEPGTVAVWSASLLQNRDVTERLRKTLSEDEKLRADRLRFEHDRRRFVVRRGMLRDVLSRYVSRRPESLTFRQGPAGKPYLVGVPSQSLGFSMSSSDDVAVLALTSLSDVGVDVEHVRPMPEAEHVIYRYCSSVEYENFRRLPANARSRGFFHCWTSKEAYVKATGSGLAALNSFEVSVAPDEPPRLVAIDGDRTLASAWGLHRFVPAADCMATLALASAQARLVEHTWLVA